MAPTLSIIIALTITQPTQDLAPDYSQLVRERRTLEALLTDEQAVRDAVARLHNAIAIAWKTQATPRCRPEVAELGARAAVLLRRHRQDAQTVRVRAKELRLLARVTTIAPLVGLDESDALTKLTTRADEAVDAHLELRAWHTRYLTPLLARCTAPLGPTAGLGPSGARNAVLVLGDALACPDRAPIRERVAVVGALACAGDAQCTCVPTTVQPGAVLTAGTATTTR